MKYGRKARKTPTHPEPQLPNRGRGERDAVEPVDDLLAGDDVRQVEALPLHRARRDVHVHVSRLTTHPLGKGQGEARAQQHTQRHRNPLCQVKMSCERNGGNFKCIFFFKTSPYV